jgi:hypothetical protein
LYIFNFINNQKKHIQKKRQKKTTKKNEIILFFIVLFLYKIQLHYYYFYSSFDSFLNPSGISFIFCLNTVTKSFRGTTISCFASVKFLSLTTSFLISSSPNTIANGIFYALAYVSYLPRFQLSLWFNSHLNPFLQSKSQILSFSLVISRFLEGIVATITSLGFSLTALVSVIFFSMIAKILSIPIDAPTAGI